jgi:oligoendopeptidase F
MASLVKISDADQPLDNSNWNNKHDETSEEGWKQVQYKKSSMNNISKERLETMRAAMQKTKSPSYYEYHRIRQRIFQRRKFTSTPFAS